MLCCFCDGISWLAPTLAFSVMIGLGLDYDVFLLR